MNLPLAVAMKEGGVSVSTARQLSLGSPMPDPPTLPVVPPPTDDPVELELLRETVPAAIRKSIDAARLQLYRLDRDQEPVAWELAERGLRRLEAIRVKWTSMLGVEI